MQHEAGGCSTAVSGAVHLQHICSVWVTTTTTTTAAPLQQLPGSAAADEGVNEILRYFMFFMSLQRSSVVFIGRFKQCLLYLNQPSLKFC